MAVDDQVVVRSVLVLTDSRFDQRSVFHSWKAKRHVLANGFQLFCAHHPLSPRGVKYRPTSIVGNFKSTTFVPRNAIEELVPVIRPHGQILIVESWVTHRSSEEKHVLLRGTDLVAKHLGKNLPEPGTASEYILIRD